MLGRRSEVWGSRSSCGATARFDGGTDGLEIANRSGGFRTLSIAYAGSGLRIAQDPGTLIIEGCVSATLTKDDVTCV